MQIVTGIVLVMHLSIDTTLIFGNVNYINQDIVYGFFLRAIHTNGASFVFVFLYFHMFRGIYYQSYRTKKEVWLRLRVALGTDVLLRGHRDYQTSEGFWTGRSMVREDSMGGLCG